MFLYEFGLNMIYYRFFKYLGKLKIWIRNLNREINVLIYILYIGWCSLAYISQNDEATYGYPLSRIYSISDGLPSNSTGIVYFMVSPLDLTAQDLKVSNLFSFISILHWKLYEILSYLFSIIEKQCLLRDYDFSTKSLLLQERIRCSRSQMCSSDSHWKL